MKQFKIKKIFLFFLLFSCIVPRNLSAMSRLRSSLPSLSNFSSLSSPEAIQSFIDRFTSIFKYLSPSSLRSIIEHQTAQFNTSFNAFIESKSTIAAAKIIAAVAAITAAATILAGVAALTYSDIVPVGKFEVGEIEEAMPEQQAREGLESIKKQREAKERAEMWKRYGELQ